MIIPSLLKSGDLISILAPARKISENELASSISLFESYGLRVQLGKTFLKNFINLPVRIRKEFPIFKLH